MSNERIEREPRSRERGVALIMVTIFGIGALILTSTLLKLTTMGITDSTERHNAKSLSAVLQAGIAAATYEIRHDQDNGPYDPGGDGVGALGAAGPANGIQVAVGGQNLGFYRTTIEKDASDRLILTVVAAYPNFTNPQRTAAAQVRLDGSPVPFTGDRNALTVVGPAGNNVDIRLSSGSRLNITDPTNTVAAVNITDSTYHTAFTGGLPGGTSISGADPANPGTGVTGAATVTNLAAGLINETSVDNMATAFRDFVNAATPVRFRTAHASNGGSTSGSHEIEGDSNLPNGVYKVSSKVIFKNSATVTGSGTLIIETSGAGNHLELQSGARLNWNGDVIIIGDKSRVEVQSGSRMNVTGNVAIVSIGTQKSDIELQSGSRLNVQGSLLQLSSGGGDNDLELQSGSRVDIDGLHVMLGEKSELKLESGSRLDVDGSTISVIPNGATGGKFDIHAESGSRLNLTFDDTNFTNALNSLGTFFTAVGAPPGPVAQRGYWEAGAGGLLAAQQTRIDNGDPLGFTNQP